MPLEEIELRAVDQEIRHLTYKEITIMDLDGRSVKTQNLLAFNTDWFIYR